MNPFDFIEIGLLDVVDIFLVAILLYYVYKLLKGTVAINIFIGIALLFVTFKITSAAGLKMFSGILGGLLGVGAVGVMIVFQQEIRKFLLMIGSTNYSNKRNFIKQLRFLKSEIHTDTDVESIITASYKLASTNTGALIVIERANSLDFIKNTGDKLNAEVSIPILESIFYKNSPLHDGAIIIKDNFIMSSRVVLPVSNKKIPKRFGLRHKAAVGITERTDAVCIIVSEETGSVSYVKDGEIVLYKDDNALIEQIRLDLS
jgi:uncharacterized protein (TIGR00159 family)